MIAGLTTILVLYYVLKYFNAKEVESKGDLSIWPSLLLIYSANVKNKKRRLTYLGAIWMVFI